jgi:hypothetical protein
VVITLAKFHCPRGWVKEEASPNIHDHHVGLVEGRSTLKGTFREGTSKVLQVLQVLAAKIELIGF